MSMVKYSMGGSITSVEDKDSVEKREESLLAAEQENFLIICKKCGIQHMLLKNEVRFCCGSTINSDKLS